jgi:hypothetical protein
MPPGAASPAPAPNPAASATGPEVWLRGNTHVHAAPSGDSRTPIPEVLEWYASRGYDWIALTDHNRVSEVDPTASTAGQPAVRAPAQGLIVLSGIELTYNPAKCEPPGDGTCRIHVNLLGPTARPEGKVSWGLGEKLPDARLPKYQSALEQQKRLGGLAQLNHPQWHWGMTAELLTELARRGMRLVEIANAQFTRWDDGDQDHPSTEALWDAALGAGVTLWGTASDDAHDYDGGGKYPAGGGWVVVKARRDPQAILDALAAGRFYASNGVALDRAGVEAGSLVVEVSAGERPGDAAAGDTAAGYTAAGYTIEFIENGARVEAVRARTARRPVPAQGYLRAVVRRDDGKRAWVQPVRR